VPLLARGVNKVVNGFVFRPKVAAQLIQIGDGHHALLGGELFDFAACFRFFMHRHCV